MSKRKNVLNYEKMYFAGIGGVSVSALAKYALLMGKRVKGSDINENFYTEYLKSKGVKISSSQNGADLKKGYAYVYSSAISEENKEYKRAKELNLPMFLRSEMLGKICERYENSVGVSGSHGKTTCSAMIASVLIGYGLSPTVFLGGETETLSNFIMGKSGYFVCEACEYKKNFLNVSPKISVVLNVDNDHLDSYKNMEDEIRAFKEFASKGIAVVNADDKNTRKLNLENSVSFGIENLAYYMAKNITENQEGYSFSLFRAGIEIGRINLGIGGKHNVYNALATISVCDILNVPFCVIKRELEKFRGAKRRNQFLKEKGGIKYYTDYAHHPREIEALFDMYKNESKEILVVFQPHTYSRTEILMREFLQSLNKFKNVIIYKTYPAREKYNENGSAKLLYENLINYEQDRKTGYADNEIELKEMIDNNIMGIKKVLFVGAGDIYEKALKILE